MTGPVWVAEVELGDGMETVGVRREASVRDDAARVLVRLHGEVLGYVTVPVHRRRTDAAKLWSEVRSRLGDRLADHLARDGLAVPAGLAPGGLGTREGCRTSAGAFRPRIDVVVCTRDRPSAVRQCLSRLRELAYETYEVVVVDNAPRTTATREVFDDAARGDDRFRYVLEPAPGLSRARNRGLAESTAAYVAFVDDDALPDIRWLQAIADGFARDARVALVTGLAPPAELDHPAQEYFDRRYPAAADPRRRLFDLSSDASSRLYPFSAGVFGCGANFAVDRRVFESLGAFDESLGAGTPSGGGEDLDAFVRVLLAGYAIAREPNAVAWHVNRLDAHALRRQLYTYGTGLTAYLTKFLVDRRTSREIISRLGAGARRVPHVWDADEISGGPPFGYFLAEAAGMVAGPVAYFRGRLRQSRVPREDAVCS